MCIVTTLLRTFNSTKIFKYAQADSHPHVLRFSTTQIWVTKELTQIVSRYSRYVGLVSSKLPAMLDLTNLLTPHLFLFLLMEVSNI